MTFRGNKRDEGLGWDGLDVVGGCQSAFHFLEISDGT